jgi:hypothetical protein
MPIKETWKPGNPGLRHIKARVSRSSTACWRTNSKYSIDRSPQPNTIDYLLTHGAAAGQKQIGIFELKGDSLKVSFAKPGQPRPSDFSSAAVDGRTVTVWQRVCT